MGELAESANNLRNTPNKNGIYLITDNALNCPETYGILISTATSFYTYQLFTRYNGVQWMRTSNEAQWYDWIMVYQHEPVTLYNSNHYLTDTIYTLNDDWNKFSRIFFIFRYADNGTYWFETTYPCVLQNQTGFHLYCAYNNQVHDAYGYFDTSNLRQMVIQGSLSGSYPYLVGVYGLYNY